MTTLFQLSPLDILHYDPQNKKFSISNASYDGTPLRHYFTLQYRYKNKIDMVMVTILNCDLRNGAWEKATVVVAPPKRKICKRVQRLILNLLQAYCDEEMDFENFICSPP